MGKDIFQQARYYDLHDQEEKVPKRLRWKLNNWYNRINFWDFFDRIRLRNYKDYKRGK